MNTAIITGSGGLIGAEAVRQLSSEFSQVVGIDNDMRAYFFGEASSTRWANDTLTQKVQNYQHHSVDIRDRPAISRLFKKQNNIELVIHTAAQPSHDWASKQPLLDFDINAVGTINMLEATRLYAPNATFIFTSTNKVYGDRPNQLPLVELETRYEVEQTHEYAKNGIPENMSIDQCLHSLFGASKVAADICVQEYGRYFGMATGVFRGGCLTGPGHSGAELHGFLSYLLKCTATGVPYNVFGYKGKQVRDNILSDDLIEAFRCFHKSPRCGEVYNIGGGRHSNCSMLEAIKMCEEICGKKLQWQYSDTNRTGDHIWYISDCNKFRNDYPSWQPTANVKQILERIYTEGLSRW